VTIGVEPAADATERESAGRPGKVRRGAWWVTTVLAGLLVLFALVAPNQPSHLTPAAFLRIPAEGLLAAVLLLALPARRRRLAAVLVGGILGLVAVLKILDIGFFRILDRPFDPVLDWPLFAPTMQFLVDTLGRTPAIALAVAAVVLTAAVLALMPLAVARLSPLVVRHRTRAAGTVAVLGAGWVGFALLGAQIVPGVPVAAHNADRVGQAYASLRDPEVFAAELAIDDFWGVPDRELLTALRGKDVVLTFVESYGRNVVDPVEDPELAAGLDGLLSAGDSRLAAAGFSARSGFLTSPVVGGSSWLAHASLLSGLWVDNQSRYDMLFDSDRLTLIHAFQRAGWRTVGVHPGVAKEWASATAGYDAFYLNQDLGYDGPSLAWSNVPDQYTLSFFERAERSRSQRPPLMAEIGLLSGHGPWPPPPQLVEWDDVGDGSVFNGMESDADPQAVVRDPDRARAAYVQAIGYSLNTLISYVETLGDDDLVMIFLGDHQPAPLVTGEGASRDVPITIVARDQAVLDRISGWGWHEGLRPGPQAPAWPMDAFRDRFLTAFGP
jgi:hypothetical protein